MKDQVKDRYNRVKIHVKENKKVYLAAAGGLAVGAVSVLLVREDIRVSQTGNKGLLIWKPVSNLEQNVLLVRRGHPGNVVKCIETGETFASQNRAAQVMQINPSELSKHVRGLKDAAGGYHFETLGEAS